MEMIEVPGYTSEEKRRIAMQHVVPRVLEAGRCTLTPPDP
jgi:ATP-dependent Lon protease